MVFLMTPVSPFFYCHLHLLSCLLYPIWICVYIYIYIFELALKAFIFQGQELNMARMPEGPNSGSCLRLLTIFNTHPWSSHPIDSYFQCPFILSPLLQLWIWCQTSLFCLIVSSWLEFLPQISPGFIPLSILLWER